MAAPRGNDYWQRRKKHGKPKKIKSANALWGYFCDYAARCDENPLPSGETRESGGKFEKKSAPKMVAYTWDGFEDYLFEMGIINDIGHYKHNRDGRYNDYVTVFKRIDKVIRNHKFVGAAAGLFNASIIARDLGLSDKQEVEVKEAKVTIKIGGEEERNKS